MGVVLLSGAQMILSMKVISVGFDVDSKRIPCIPSALSFVSYCLSPSTLIFGPWTNYSDYLKTMNRDNLEVSCQFSTHNLVFCKLWISLTDKIYFFLGLLVAPKIYCNLLCCPDISVYIYVLDPLVICE